MVTNFRKKTGSTREWIYTIIEDLNRGTEI